MLAGEIARSADVFPLLFDDVRRCHSVLYGSDPFATLVIQKEHIRLRTSLGIDGAGQILCSEGQVDQERAHAFVLTPR